MIYSFAAYTNNSQAGPRKPGIPFAEAAARRRAAVGRRVDRAVAEGEALELARRAGGPWREMAARVGDAEVRFLLAIHSLAEHDPARAAAIRGAYLGEGRAA